MAAEYSAFKRGGVTFPVTAATTNAVLRDADPFIYGALDYFSAMLTYHLGSRFTAEAASGRAALKSPAQAAVTAIVGSAVPYNPARYLQAEQLLFPVLAVFRVEEEYRDKTVTWRSTATRCRVAWILPPLSVQQAHVILPFLGAVGKVLDDRTEVGAQPSYTPPFTAAVAGASIWAACGIEQIVMASASYGAFGGDEAPDLYFPAYLGELEVRERTGTPSAFDALSAAPADIDLQNADGTALYPDLVQIDPDVTP